MCVKMIINFEQKRILNEDFLEWVKKLYIVGIIVILPMWVGFSLGRIILKGILREP